MYVLQPRGQLVPHGSIFQVGMKSQLSNMPVLISTSNPPFQSCIWRVSRHIFRPTYMYLTTCITKLKYSRHDVVPVGIQHEIVRKELLASWMYFKPLSPRIPDSRPGAIGIRTDDDAAGGKSKLKLTAPATRMRSDVGSQAFNRNPLPHCSYVE